MHAEYALGSLAESSASVRVGRLELPRACAPHSVNERRLPVPPHPHSFPTCWRSWALRRAPDNGDAAGGITMRKCSNGTTTRSAREGGRKRRRGRGSFALQ